MRILQVVNVRWFNATAWYGLKLAQLLSQVGHQVKIVVLPQTETATKAESMGLDCIYLPLNSKNPLDYPQLIWQMYRLLTHFKPQIVNCHRGEGHILWSMLRFVGNYKLVRTRGDQRLPRNNWLNRLLYAKCQAVIATNTWMSAYLIQELRLESAKVFTILGGVGSEFKKDLAGRQVVRFKYGFAESDFVLGLLGRFDLVKGQKELLAVVGNLVRKGYPIKLMLLGFPTATSQAEVESWIAQEGLQQQVVITGVVTDVVSHINALDLGIISSLGSEAIARAAVEILACQQPLLSTAVGVMPDLLPAEALAKTVADLEILIEKALNEPEYLVSIQKKSVQLTDEDFLQQTLKAYDLEM